MFGKPFWKGRKRDLEVNVADKLKPRDVVGSGKDAAEEAFGVIEGSPGVFNNPELSAKLRETIERAKADSEREEVEWGAATMMTSVVAISAIGRAGWLSPAPSPRPRPKKKLPPPEPEPDPETIRPTRAFE